MISVLNKRKDSINYKAFCNNYKLNIYIFLAVKGAGFLFEKMTIFTVLTVLMLAAVASSQNGNYFIWNISNISQKQPITSAL